MAWDDIKVANNDFLSADWNAMVTDQKTRIVVSTGVIPPTSTPSSVGDIYIDTAAGKMYVAMGTSSSADWKKVVSQ